MIQDVSSPPAPRLCHIIKWRADAGYGFHLLADKKRVGHFIGKVDADTPAESAGLRVSDRIIEVNGNNVTLETHKQIVERIKAVPNETRLLVLDPEADAYYAERGIQVSGVQSNVVHLRTPTARSNNNKSTGDDSSSNDDGDDVRVQLRHQHNGSQVTKHNTTLHQNCVPTSLMPWEMIRDRRKKKRKALHSQSVFFLFPRGKNENSPSNKASRVCVCVGTKMQMRITTRLPSRWYLFSL